MPRVAAQLMCVPGVLEWCMLSYGPIPQGMYLSTETEISSPDSYTGASPVEQKVSDCHKSGENFTDSSTLELLMSLYLLPH